MFAKIARWFKGPTDEEMYAKGIALVDSELKRATDDTVGMVENLFALSDGCFNETSAHKAYDRGIRDRLRELGFESPESPFQ